MSELSRDVYEALVEAIPSAVVLFDDAGTVRVVNRRARALLGGLDVGASIAAKLGIDPGAATIEATQSELSVEELEAPAPGLRLIAVHAPENAADELSRYVAVLGHELRNPLAPLRLAAEHILSDDADLEATSAIIDRQVAQMARLVDDLLDTARLERGKLRLAREPIRVLDAVESALQMSRPGLEAREHTLTVDLERLERVEVEADAARLSQALANLLSNATLYTPSRGVIELRGWVDDDARVHLEVKDNGQGIDADALSTIFDTFAQPQRADTPSAGLGLGLGLSREIVRLHGGTLRASSPGRDRGACFEIILPGATTVSSVAPTAEPTPMTHRSVLIVDDNEDAATMLSIVLGSQDIECTVVHNGEDALSAMASRRFDVAVVDIGLPDIDGLEVARRARGLDWCPDRLVGLSGYGQRSDHEAANEAGFDAYFVKPLAPDALGQLLG
ncbi:MAG: ATP-binding protein [Nannocystaceae bacterium]|nr:ATP-binding protein [bacterium]